MNRKITALVFFFSLTAILLNAQPYQSAMGVRLGFGLGVTYKGFVSSKAAIEGIAQYDYSEHGYGLCGMYELHNYHAFRTSNLALIYGFGGHMAYYHEGYYKNRSEITYETNTLNFGIDGMLGID